MITPLLFVIHADALLLLSAGFDHRSIGFNDGLFKEVVRLLLPGDASNLVEALLQLEDVLLMEATAEIACRRGVGNPLSPKGVQPRLVVADLFQMVQTRPARQQVQCNVEHMVGFIIRQMKLQQSEVFIDRFTDTECLDRLKHDPDATCRNRLLLLGQLVPDRRRINHG